MNSLVYYNNVYIYIHVGGIIKLNSLVYYPPRNGPTLWAIGIPDRSAHEFYVPDAYANLTNKLYVNDFEDRLVIIPYSIINANFYY